MQIIADALSHIMIGQPVSCGNLTMFPLLNGGAEIADYLTLDDAIKQGQAIITEVSNSGSVPELSFTNKGDLPVLLVDGEELIGAKQNRILNLTILAPAHQKLNISVSCVERGRWSYRSAAFASAPRAQFADARANKVASVSFSLRERGRADSDQNEVWGDIDRMAKNLRVESPTNAMSDLYESYSANLDEFIRKLSPVKTQVGAAFAISGEIVGFDLFDRASTLKKLLTKLVSSYAIQALSRRAEVVETPREEDVREMLDAVSNSQGRSFTATGEGEDVRIEENGLSAAALVAKGRLIHLCGFRVKTSLNKR